jgi:hypothetical protein
MRPLSIRNRPRDDAVSSPAVRHAAAGVAAHAVEPRSLTTGKRVFRIHFDVPPPRRRALPLTKASATLRRAVSSTLPASGGDVHGLGGFFLILAFQVGQTQRLKFVQGEGNRFQQTTGTPAV